MRGPNQPKPLTSADIRALRMLDRYRLLTFDQAARVGLGSRDQVRDQFLKLQNWKLIGRTEERDPSLLSKLPLMHFLKTAGARELESALGKPALASKRRFRTQNEVAHRRGIVDTHIAFRQWAKRSNFWQVETFTTDFEPTKNKGRYKATALDSLPGHGVRYPPDATAHLREGDGTLWGMLLEYERGGQRGDLSRFRREKLPLLREIAGGQPRNPTDARLVGFIEDQFAEGMTKAVRFAVVFEDEARRDKALATWPDRTSPDWRRFFVKALPELHNDFNGGWWQPDGTRRPMFGVAPLTAS